MRILSGCCMLELLVDNLDIARHEGHGGLSLSPDIDAWESVGFCGCTSRLFSSLSRKRKTEQRAAFWAGFIPDTAAVSHDDLPANGQTQTGSACPRHRRARLHKLVENRF